MLFMKTEKGERVAACVYSLNKEERFIFYLSRKGILSKHEATSASRHAMAGRRDGWLAGVPSFTVLV